MRNNYKIHMGYFVTSETQGQESISGNSSATPITVARRLRVQIRGLRFYKPGAVRVKPCNSK